ncbi:MAG: hypothetical protein MI922_00280 [Bacteroidales bacterium]|nr:hypothetical protein [Bacteroidales bacterium]
MFKNKNIDITFLVFSLIALFLFLYLTVKVLQSMVEVKEIIKFLAVIIIPMPAAIFIAAISASKNHIIKQTTNNDKIKALVLFAIISGFCVLVIHQYDKIGIIKFRDMQILPVFIHTIVTFSFLINNLTSKNLIISSILGGLLLGFSIYFFTLT